jgi:hypothetical protein
MGFNYQVNLTKLTCTSRLFFMAVVGLSNFGDGFTVGYSRRDKLNF